MLPELFVSNIVSDDAAVTDLTIWFIPHHIQLGRSHCTHTNVLRGPFRPLAVRDELEILNVIWIFQERDRSQNSYSEQHSSRVGM